MFWSEFPHVLADIIVPGIFQSNTLDLQRSKSNCSLMADECGPIINSLSLESLQFSKGQISFLFAKYAEV